MLTDLSGEFKKGLVYYHNAQFDRAKEICRKILSINQDHSESLHLLGMVELQLGHFDVAIDLLNKAVKLFPEQPSYLNALGRAYRKASAWKDAVFYYEQAIKLNPLSVETYMELGDIFFEQKLFKKAAGFYESAVKLKPDSLELYNNLGRTYVEIDDKQKAIKCYEKIVQIKPDIVEAFFCLGLFNCEIGNIKKAVEYYEKAIKISPEHPGAYSCLGNIYLLAGNRRKAIEYFEKAINVNPDEASCYGELAGIYFVINQIEKAIECYRKALSIDPKKYSYCRGPLLLVLRQNCAWEESQNEAALIDQLAESELQKGKHISMNPFCAIAISDDNRFNFLAAKSWAEAISKSVSDLVSSDTFETHISLSSKKKNGKIVLGYLSSDFYNHPTSHLLLNLFNLHDRKKFKVICYSHGIDDQSHYRKKIMEDSDEFVDLRFLGVLESAKRITMDGVDILIDLKGYTMGHRMGICACRPAPVQVSYLGFPGTTGSDFIDYIVTDKIVTPLEYEEFYSEKFIYMPDCYQINDKWQPVSDLISSREDFGFSQDQFVFCSFNTPYKIEPVMFDSWMRILKRVPESVLWLLKINDKMEENIKNEAEKREVDPKRIIFSEKISKDKHLARLKLSDLALDTRIVNGHTTTSDALWAGIPVITLPGRHFASRVSSSILSAVGLSGLIAKNFDDYEDLAVGLARDLNKMEKIRMKLEKNRLVKPLFDTPMFVKHLEVRYKEIWKIFQKGETPRHINPG